MNAIKIEVTPMLSHRMLSSMFPALAFLFLSSTVGCEGPSTCTPGQSSECACVGGSDGAQVCNDDGTFGECACVEGDGGTPTPEGEPDGTPEPGPEGEPEQDPHAVLEAFSSRLAGLWQGPATQTVLGDFPIMIMDFRPVADSWFFGRVDLDSANNLRFLFDVEEINGGPALVYRNGGFFQGLFRDSRTILVESQPDAGYFRFCSADRGCDYIDAIFNFPAADRLEFDATVMGETHVVWNANRRVENVVDDTFPATSVLDEGADFPPLPRAEITATFPDPDDDVKLFIALATEDCTLVTIAACDFSRSYVIDIGAGDTTARADVEQIHPGTYQAMAVVDKDGIPGPSTGDDFSLLSELVVPNDANATATANVQVIDF